MRILAAVSFAALAAGAYGHDGPHPSSAAAARALSSALPSYVVAVSSGSAAPGTSASGTT